MRPLIRLTGLKKTAAEILSVCSLMFAVTFLFPQNSLAQSCPSTYLWPTISTDWRLGPENKYTSGGLNGGVGTTGGACDCTSVSVSGDECSIYIDGQLLTTDFALCGGNIPFEFSVPDIISEGAHNVYMRLTARGCDQVQTYTSPTKDFHIDKTPPVITLTKPENSVVISTVDLAVSGNISDSASKVGNVDVRLSITNGPCYFNRDLSGVAVASSSIYGTYCSSYYYNGEANQLMHGCNADIGAPATFSVNQDLRNLVDFSSGQDCKFFVSVGGMDRVANYAETKNLSFMVDQAPPVIQISSFPIVTSSGPITTIAGTAADSSDIIYVKFQLEQADWKNTKTYWNGTAWAAATNTIVNLVIPPSTNTVIWSYSGLTARDIVSGSHYKLTFYSADKFGHIGIAETEFDYDTCSSGILDAVPNNGEDIFEVGTAVFRQLATGIDYVDNKTGHVGVYVVSDSRYAIKNGGSTAAFVAALSNNNGQLLTVEGSDANHFIVHSMDKAGVVYTSLSGFKTVVDYWGAREPVGLGVVDRDWIAFFASLQLGKPYADMGVNTSGKAWLPVGKDWAGGTEPKHFRCDGLVVYAYNQAQRDGLVAGYSRWTTPVKMANQWLPVASLTPGLSNLQITQNGDKFNISAYAWDDESGIDRVEYFLRRSPDIGGTEFLGTVERDSLVPDNYSLQNTCNPGTNLFLRVVDRAGNWQMLDSKLIAESRSGSPKTYQLPPLSPSPPGPIRPNLRPLDIRSLSEQAFWHYKDDATATENLLAYYVVDLPFDSWNMDAVAKVAGGNSGDDFSAGPGTHTFYLAMMDEHGNFAFQEAPFTVPDVRTILTSAKTVQAGDDVALYLENETAPGAYSAEKMDMTWPAPEGYFNSPASAVYDIKTTAQYSGGIGLIAKINGQNLSNEEKKHLHLLHLAGGIWEDATVGVDPVNNLIFGYSTSLSPFAIYSSPESVPERAYPDRWPPRTEITSEGAIYTNPGGKNYISSSTSLGFRGIDDHAGNTSTYYKFEIPAELIAAGLKPETTGQFSAYSGSLLAGEGKHFIGYGSIDAAGNYELLKTATFYVDATPPVSEIRIGTITVLGGGSIYITEADSITISAFDPEISLAASGVKAIYRLVDVSPVECESAMPPAACSAAEYAAPFSLSAGTHTVYYGAVDNVGNVAAVKSVLINVRRPVKFYPGAKTANSITWQWDPVAGATAYQVFSSTGGAVSGVLTAGASQYLQAGLTPNARYSNFVRTYGAAVLESAASEAVTYAAPPGIIEVFNFGQSASIVIGQPDFVTLSGGTSPNKLRNPRALAFDAAGALWVSDKGNNRVLRFSPPFSTYMPADLVIGKSNYYDGQSPSITSQSTLYQATSLDFDKEGKLWVQDGGGRILRFSPPFSTGMNANLAIGVDNFYSSGGGCARNRTSNGNWGQIAFDETGALWSSDYYYNRVLRFSPPFSMGMNSDLVLGQPNFTSCSPGIYPYVPTANNLYSPLAVKSDSRGNIWVADTGNNRVVKYAPPLYQGMAATTVLGQKNFVEKNVYTTYTPNAASLNFPAGLEFDGQDNLYVVDYTDKRVVKYRPPFSDGMAASLVIGQNDFSSVFNMNLQAAFAFPMGVETSGFVAADEKGRLWVADYSYSRILMFEPVRAGVFTGIGSSSFTVNWLAGGNPADTYYVAELSDKPDFMQNVHAVETVGALSAQFVNLNGNTRYYARLKAKNSAGAPTAYIGLGSVLTKPAMASDFAGLAASPESILWTWGGAAAGVEFRIYSSSGGAISPVLAAGTTSFLQAGLNANQEYANYIRATNSVGGTDSGVARRTTLSAGPIRIEPFDNGQNAELVIGQADFAGATYGISADKFSSLSQGVFDSSGALWVLDRCRVLRFSPPFTDNISADLVLGQPDFVSMNCATSANAFLNGDGLAFGKDGALWVSDANSNRVLRFSPPFSSGKPADLVIGQGDFSSAASGTAANKFISPRGISISKDGALWVADGYNYRILRFSPPFSAGMSADLVLGQPDFTSNNYPPHQATNARMFVAQRLAFDNKGALWVPDADRRRVLMFAPPFANGIAASFVLGQPDFAHPVYNLFEPCPLPTQSGFCTVNSVSFDEEGNLYLGENSIHAAGNRTIRVLKYRPPFRNIMDASVVLGQPDFNSSEFTVSQNRLRGVSALLPTTHDGRAALWALDAGAYRILKFGENHHSFRNVASSSMVVVWEGGINPPGTEYYIQAATTPVFDAGVLSKPWTAETNALFNGLSEKTTYYARVKSRNTEGVESGYLRLGYAPTTSPYIVVNSPALVDGNPEVSLRHTSAMTVSPLDSGTAAGAIAIGTAAGMGLTLASNLYVVGPDGLYEPPAQLTFYYSTAALAGAGLTTADIAVYEFFSAEGWVLLPGQQLDEAAHRISVPVSRIASIFGIFGVVKDRLPPVTEFSVIGDSWSSAGSLYINRRSSVALAAYDPIAYGTSTGVSFMEFRIDGSSGSGFNLYDGPFGLQGGAHRIEFRGTDKAGNLEDIRSLAITVDAYPPESKLLLSGTMGQNNWRTSAVWAQITSSDALSGTAGTYYSLDGSSYTVYLSSFQVVGEGEHGVRYYSVDNVLNAESAKSFEFGIDLSTPSVGYLLAPAANEAGWNRTPVEVTITGTDTVSGIAYCSSSFTISGEGYNPVSGYCSDYAGWSSTVSFAANVDTTPPVSSAEITGVAGLNGWFKSATAISLASSDTLSGAAGLQYSLDGSSFSLYESSFSVANTGAHLLKYYSADKAGNAEPERSAEFMLDLDVPVVTGAVSPEPNLSGWNNGPVTVIFTGTDSVSGIAYCEPHKALALEGSSQHVNGYCVDYAGWSSTASLTVNIDTTAPSLSYTAEPAANDKGWNKSDVLLKFTCADRLSGVKSCPADITLAGEGVNISTSAAAFDLAGNPGYATAAINIDRTPPAITISSPAAGQIFVATRGRIYAGFGVQDNLDPAPAFNAFLVQTEDRGSPRGNRPAVIAVSNDQSLEPLDIDDGLWRLAVSATDFADNAALLPGGAFEVVHDVLAPRTGHAIISGPSLIDGATTYIANAARLELTSIDDLVLAGDGIGLGVKGQAVRLWSGGSLVKELSFTNPLPRQGETFISSFTGAGLGLADGSYSLAYTATDILGNAEAEKSFLVGLDNAAPVSTAALAGTTGGSGWHISTVTVSLSAVDALSGAAGIYYKLDNDAFLSYTSAFATAAEGPHIVKFYGKDRLGNTEAEKSTAFKIDRTPPAGSLSVSGELWESGSDKYLNLRSAIALTAADGLSGVAAIEFRADEAPFGVYSSSFSLAEGMRTVHYRAIDKAGNIEAIRTALYRVDGTKPLTGLSLSGDQYNGDKQYISQRTDIIITAADPVVNNVAVGVKETKYSMDGGLFVNYSPFRLSAEGKRLVSYYSTDFVSNIETVKTAVLWVDNTPPSTELSITGARYTAPGDEKLYITRDSGIVLTSSDSLSNDTASGVMLTKYRLDGGNWQVYSGSFTIAAEGLHTLEYYALDRVQNAEPLKSAKIAVDNTPPAGRLTPGLPKYELDGYTLVSAATLLTLEAADPLSGGIASGVSGIYYSIGASPAVPYFTPFALAGGGLNTVRWWSADNVRNAEPAHTAVYELDNEAPALKLDCPGESFSEICNIYNSTFTVYGTVSDKYLKSWRLDYAPGADAQGGYLPVSSGALNIAGAAMGLLNPAGLAGAYTLRLSAADLVENAAVRQVNIRIGVPSVQLSLGGHKLLNKPEAVTADGEGRIYIADTNNDRLALYTSTGGFVRYYGGGDDDDDKRGKRDTAPRFNKPGAVAAAQNQIYVSDTNNNRVVKISTAGVVLLTIGGRVRGEDDDDDDKKVPGTADPLRLDKPRGLAVDAAGDLYVADSGNNRVLKLDAAGKELMRIILPVITKDEHDDDDERGDDDHKDAAAGPGKPQGLALDGAGNIYITDPEGGRVLIYDAMGGLLTQVKAFKRPYGIAVSPDAECLLIADAKTGGVYKLDRNKAVNLSFGAKAGGNDETGKDDDDDKTNDPLSLEFNKPGLLAFGADGSLYLADRNNNRVVKLGLPVAAPLVIDGRKGGKNRTSAALAVQGNLIAPLAGPDPSFRLGEVYVFPNPAKGTEAPVFHIETGIADSVKITIYTISGRSAHEHTLTGLPAELDDGNGLSYAYEYTWRGHIPSGVYLYHIEAQKAGQKLKKTGKFGIVR